MSENPVLHPAVTVLTALFNGAVIREPSGRRVCLGYEDAGRGAPVLCVQADRERPGQPPDTVLLPLDVTVTDFIEWAAKLPAPVDTDPLHLGDFGLEDARATLPGWSDAQLLTLLDENRDALEERLGAKFRALLHEFANDYAAAAAEPAPF